MQVTGNNIPVQYNESIQLSLGGLSFYDPENDTVFVRHFAEATHKALAANLEATLGEPGVEALRNDRVTGLIYAAAVDGVLLPAQPCDSACDFVVRTRTDRAESTLECTNGGITATMPVPVEIGNWIESHRKSLYVTHPLLLDVQTAREFLSREKCMSLVTVNVWEGQVGITVFRDNEMWVAENFPAINDADVIYYLEAARKRGQIADGTIVLCSGFMAETTCLFLRRHYRRVLSAPLKSWLAYRQTGVAR